MKTRLEELLEALNKGEPINYECRSRLEEHLVACINKTGIGSLGDPRCRAEELLQVHAEQMANGGGSSGGGIVTIEREAGGLQAVPNTGVVEKIVFNTSLTPDEVNSIITNANLTFALMDTASIYVIFGNATANLDISIIDFGKLVGVDNGYIIGSGTSEFFMYVSPTLPDMGLGFTGWNPDMPSELPLGLPADSTYDGLTVGLQNEVIKELVNIGSGEAYYKELSGTYEPVTVSVTANTTIDVVSEYIDNKQIPINVMVNTPQPIGEIIINKEGTYDVTNYESAIVNITNFQFGKVVTPTTSRQTIYTDSGYTGFKSIVVEAVTSAIDSDITPSNIKKGVNILGIIGSYEPSTVYTEIVNDKITEIGKYAYMDLKFSLLEIPNATTIGQYAFWNSTMPYDTLRFDNLTTIGPMSFENTNISDINSESGSPYLYCPNVMRIDPYAFKDCSGLECVTLENVSFIDGNAFKNCDMLSVVNLGENLTELNDIFPGCSSLSQLTLSANQVVSVINSEVLKDTIFDNPTYVEIEVEYEYDENGEIVIDEETGEPIIISENEVEYEHERWIFVPEELVTEYQEHEFWGKYSDIIYPLGDIEE